MTEKWKLAGPRLKVESSESDGHSIALEVQCAVELQTKVCYDLTVTKKALTMAFFA